MPGRLQKILLTAVLLAMTFGPMSLITGCRTPLAYTEAGSYETRRDLSRRPTRRRDVLKQIALYLPNRIVDVFDVVHFSVGVGVPIGFDIRLTKWAQMAASFNVGVGVGWQGRHHQPAVYGVGYTAAIGPVRTGTGNGRALKIADWEIGVDAYPIKAAVDMAEVVDMILGWFFVDILVDDWGWAGGPGG